MNILLKSFPKPSFLAHLFKPSPFSFRTFSTYTSSPEANLQRKKGGTKAKNERDLVTEAAFLYESKEDKALQKVLCEINSVNPSNTFTRYIQILRLLNGPAQRAAAEAIFSQMDERLHDDSHKSREDLGLYATPLELKYKAFALSNLQQTEYALASMDLYFKSTRPMDDPHSLLLQIKLQLKSRRFYEALKSCAEYEEAYLIEDSLPSILEVQFYKAVALHHMHVTDKALQLINQVIQKATEDHVLLCHALLQRFQMWNPSQVKQKLQDLDTCRQILDKDEVGSHYSAILLKLQNLEEGFLQ